MKELAHELAFASVKELRNKLARKEITPQELVQASIKRFELYDPALNSAIEVFEPKSILAELSSNPSASLWGIPGLIKDVICQRNRITSCASRILSNFVSPYDATAVARLKQAGALSLGRANCDEFAMGSSGETSAYGKTANPWDIHRVPGGSSSGSAAAVAAGLVPWALGTETGGSVRQPASLCGIVGIKPTYGRVSRYGLVAYGSSIDQIGVLTRTVYDNALVLQAIAGHDTNDSTSRPEPVPDYTRALTGKIKPGLKIGIIDNALNVDGFDPDVRSALDQALGEFQKLGAQLVHVSLSLMDYAAAVYFMVSRAEAASNLARFDGVRYGYRAPDSPDLATMYARTRSEGFGHTVKQRILVGNYVLSAGHADQYYKSAKTVQALMRTQFLEIFKQVDLLFAPVSPTPAFTFGSVSGFELDLQDYFTASANLTGLPALAVPCGFTRDKLPIGFQIIGPDLTEELLYQAAYAYEQSTPWHTHHPTL
jgi:aspartyl-tRNA(Asn)/glutamyl-tRNA(Gln) amidotransferase subunit A